MTNKYLESVKIFALKSKRVWLVLKRPSRNEYETIAKVSAIGIVILGFIGFVISSFMKIFVS
ncbi:MAG: protein translocase SEC61 complex subunit gamma [Nanoarchaeota archaeon]|nr:protein translocase SEC61 complex subunit gamma [Nanoarchaeota archaeon]